jgi:hypothetical protein
VENEAVPMYIMFLFEVPRVSPALYFLSYNTIEHSIFINQCIRLVVRTVREYFIA